MICCWRSDVLLQTWKSLPDSNEVSKDIPGIVINNVEATIEQLGSSNIFFIAKRKNGNQEVLYLSGKIPKGIPFLIELTATIGVPGLKCAIKSPSPEMGPLFFEGLETLLKGWFLSRVWLTFLYNFFFGSVCVSWWFPPDFAVS